MPLDGLLEAGAFAVAGLEAGALAGGVAEASVAGCAAGCDAAGAGVEPGDGDVVLDVESVVSGFGAAAAGLFDGCSPGSPWLFHLK